MRTNQHRRSWTAEEKRGLVNEARARLARGETLSAVATRLGVLEGSLRLWMRQVPERGLQPVEIVEDDAMPAPRGLVLRLPSGVRVEGLDVVSAAQLLEALR